MTWGQLGHNLLVILVCVPFGLLGVALVWLILRMWDSIVDAVHRLVWRTRYCDRVDCMSCLVALVDCDGCGDTLYVHEAVRDGRNIWCDTCQPDYDTRSCDACGVIDDAGGYPDWPNGVCADCESMHKKFRVVFTCAPDYKIPRQTDEFVAYLQETPDMYDDMNEAKLHMLNCIRMLTGEISVVLEGNLMYRWVTFAKHVFSHERVAQRD